MLTAAIPCAPHEDYDYLVPCAAGDEDISITAQYAGVNGVEVEIEVPLRNMLVPAREKQGSNKGPTSPLVINGTEQCIHTAWPMPDNGGKFGIGDPVFRSAYVLFNLDERTISLAPASYNTQESNVVPIGPGHGAERYPEGTTGGKRVGRRWWS